MKKVVLLCLMALMGAGVCAAQQTRGAKKGTSSVVFATDIECEGCAKKIMDNVPSLGKGIKDVSVDVPSKQVTVVFDAAKNDVAHIVKGFESLKVKAAPVQIDGKDVCTAKGDAACCAEPTAAACGSACTAGK